MPRLSKIAAGLPELVAGLSPEGGRAAAEGIMTTDTVMKEVAVEFTLGGKICHLGGIAKGSGMIHPNMATMLVFLTTDAAISPAMLQKALSGDIAGTFNMSVHLKASSTYPNHHDPLKLDISDNTLGEK